MVWSNKKKLIMIIMALSEIIALPSLKNSPKNKLEHTADTVITMEFVMQRLITTTVSKKRASLQTLRRVKMPAIKQIGPEAYAIIKLAR